MLNLDGIGARSYSRQEANGVSGLSLMQCLTSPQFKELLEEKKENAASWKKTRFVKSMHRPPTSLDK